jgi:hypothetical protein
MSFREKPKQSKPKQSQQSRLELGCVATVDSHGRTIFVADAHRDDGKQFVVRTDEKGTAFVELESAIRGSSSFLLRDTAQAQKRTTKVS